MNLIIDTILFLAICRGEEEAGRIFSKAIRVCDLVLVSESIILEYVNVLSRVGLGRVVHVKLAEIDAHKKLRNLRNLKAVDKIYTHEKDRHLIECAYSREGTIITYERTHFLDIRSEIKKSLNIEILSPFEYLSLPESD